MADFKIIDQPLYDFISKELRKRFPDIKIHSSSLGKGRRAVEDRYIQLSTVLKDDMDIHYEYYQGHVELHFEGKYQKDEATHFVSELRRRTTDNPVLSWMEWQKHENSRCRIDKTLNNPDEIVDAFKAIIEIFDPIIEAALKQKSMQENNPQKTSSEQNKNVDAAIVSVGEVLSISNLRIPEYQRPYCWKEKNVRQLLEDILESKNAGKKRYRIGSVILYQNTENKDKTLDIVDGQQRLTTLFILAKACGENITQNSLRYNHVDSVTNIKGNDSFIRLWLDENCKENRGDYLKYIKESCEFVKIIVYDLSEAFQMFDSQNGRGKELEAYNLLKAYHIRAMEQESREDKINCDKRWENATQYDATPKIANDPNIDVLKQLFDEQLYRSRIWSRKEKAGEFSKKEIDEFKGFTIDKNHPAVFPYQNPQLLQYLTAKFYKNVLSGTVATQNRFIGGDNDNIDPFVNINQHIVNGKPFFDFIETYVEIYKRMFIDVGTYQLSEFKEFYYSFCLNYGDDKENRTQETAFKPKYPATRDGDTYLREAYKSLTFVLFDKFGEVGLNKYYKTLYRLIYCHRLEKNAIKYSFVESLPSEYFRIISEAKDLADLSELSKKFPESNVINEYKYKDKISDRENKVSVQHFILTGEVIVNRKNEKESKDGND